MNTTWQEKIFERIERPLGKEHLRHPDAGGMSPSGTDALPAGGVHGGFMEEKSEILAKEKTLTDSRS